MTNSPDNLKIENNEASNRFEIQFGGSTAFLAYERRGSRIILVDTQVPKEMEGKGIGGKLAQAGLDYAREHDLKAVPLCPFVASYTNRHPEYEDAVSRDAG